MSERTWEFWIDVGGTFTDCIARRPDGSIVRHKLLSSGVTKGAVGEGSGGTRIVDRAQLGAKTDFWKGYVLRLLDDAGHTVDERKVASFDAERCSGDVPSVRISPTPPSARRR